MAIIYVDQRNKTGNRDGTSWDDAYISIANAIDDAIDSDTVCIAQGRYNIPSTLTIDSCIHLIGGFYGDEVSDIPTSTTAYPTILDFSGLDIYAGSSIALNNDNDIYYIRSLTIANRSSLAIGGTIRPGIINCCRDDVECQFRQLTVTGCTSFYSPLFGPSTGVSGVQFYLYGSNITNNDFVPYGAMGMIQNTSHNMYIYNTLFSNNNCSSNAMIYCDNVDSTTVLLNCTMVNNICKYTIRGEQKLPHITRCNLSYGGSLVGSAAHVYCDNKVYDGYESAYLYNNVYAGPFSNYAGDADDLTGSDNNISENPRFVDVQNDNYSYFANSPCVSGGVAAIGVGYNSNDLYKNDYYTTHYPIVEDISVNHRNPWFGHNNQTNPANESAFKVKPSMVTKYDRKSQVVFNPNKDFLQEVDIQDRAEIMLTWAAVDTFATKDDEITQDAARLYRIFAETKYNNQHPSLIVDPYMVLSPWQYGGNCSVNRIQGAYCSTASSCYQPTDSRLSDYSDGMLGALSSINGFGVSSSSWYIDAITESDYPLQILRADITGVYGGIDFTKIEQEIHRIRADCYTRVTHSTYVSAELKIWDHINSEWVTLESKAARDTNATWLLSGVVEDSVDLLTQYAGNGYIYIALYSPTSKTNFYNHHMRIILNGMRVRWLDGYRLRDYKGLYGRQYNLGKEGTILLEEIL